MIERQYVGFVARDSDDFISMAAYHPDRELYLEFHPDDRKNLKDILADNLELSGPCGTYDFVLVGWAIAHDMVIVDDLYEEIDLHSVCNFLGSVKGSAGRWKRLAVNNASSKSSKRDYKSLLLHAEESYLAFDFLRGAARELMQ